MGLTLLTALELAGNYPDDILINGVKDETNSKYASFCYLKRDGSIHKIMLSTGSVFETEEDAIKYMEDIAKSCKEQYGKG